VPVLAKILSNKLGKSETKTRIQEINEMLLRELESLVSQIHNYDVIYRLNKYNADCGYEFRDHVISAKAAIQVAKMYKF